MSQLDIAELFRDLADRFDGIVHADYSKPVHFACELDQYGLQAARLLESGVEAGLFPGFSAPYRTFHASLERRFEGGGHIRYENEDERLKWMWTQAITSWLREEYPEALRGDGNELDFKHKKVKSGAKRIPIVVSRNEEGEIVRHVSKLPDDAIICIERDVSDEQDMIARYKWRARNYADACRLLARLATDGGVPPKKPGRVQRIASWVLKHIVAAVIVTVIGGVLVVLVLRCLGLGEPGKAGQGPAPLRSTSPPQAGGSR